MPAGTKVFLYLNDIVVKALDSATAGAEFLFGRLAPPPGQKNPRGEEISRIFPRIPGLFPTILAFHAPCGFAHVAPMAIFVVGLAPGRKKDIASVGLRTLVAATPACLMTASIAGIFYTGQSAILGASVVSY